MAERIHEILPETEVVEYPVVYGAENRDLLDFASYDYIVDAIDTVTSKLILIEEAKKALLQEVLLQVETVFLSDPELLKALPKLAKEQIIFYDRSTLPEAELAPLLDEGVKVLVRDANDRASHDRLLFFPIWEI